MLTIESPLARQYHEEHKARQASYSALALREREARRKAELERLHAKAEAARIKEEERAAKEASQEVYEDDALALRVVGYPSIRRIIRIVSAAYKVPVNEILSRRRPAYISLPRHVAIYLAKVTTLRSLPEIGRQFDHRDHTTVLNSVNGVKRLMSMNEEFRFKVESIRAAVAFATGVQMAKVDRMRRETQVD